MADLYVKVQRGWSDPNNKSKWVLLGQYVSKVYDIQGDKMLVYDEGDGDRIPAHFEWVDITEYYIHGNDLDTTYYVTLYEEAEHGN